jgi:hypothetical protein
VRKRYILLEAEGRLGAAEVASIRRYVEERFGKVKLIQVRESGEHVIVRTTADVASAIRAGPGEFRAGGMKVSVVLTSGSIGKLKRSLSAGGGRDDGKVP